MWVGAGAGDGATGDHASTASSRAGSSSSSDSGTTPSRPAAAGASVAAPRCLRGRPLGVLPSAASGWAAVLAYGEGALLSHRSAAALWGSPAAGGADRRHGAMGRQGPSRRERDLDPPRPAPSRGPARRGGDPGHHRRPHAVRPRRSRRFRAARGAVGRSGSGSSCCELRRGRARLRARLRPPRPQADSAASLAEARASRGPARRSRTASSASPPLRPAAAHSTNVERPRHEVDVALARRQADRRARQLGNSTATAPPSARPRPATPDLLVAGYRTIRVTHDRLDDPSRQPPTALRRASIRGDVCALRLAPAAGSY